MRALKWAILNGLFLASLYFGLVEGVTGALRIGVFFAWFAFVIAIFACVPKVADEAFKRAPSVPRALSVAVDVAAVSMLVWHGYLMTGVAFLLHAVLIYGAADNARKRAALARCEGGAP